MNTAGISNQSRFSRIPSVSIRRSVFDRSSMHKTTFNSGYIIPFFVDEVLPGDTMKCRTGFLLRLLTPFFPYMDTLLADVHYFFVANRTVWENWERFNGAQDDPTDSTDFLVPQLDDATHAAGFAQGSIYDYLGLPTKVLNIPQARMPNALVLRAYNKIWNEWYRDENHQNSLTVSLGDGPDTTAFALQRRNRRKDYFTSCLTEPQKGPSVLLPLGTQAPVTGIGFLDGSTTAPIANADVNESDGDVHVYPFALSVRAATSDVYMRSTQAAADGDPMVFANLEDATAATINELREAFQIQRLFERDARGGTRYVEILLSHFGVVSPDFRLQRAEFLGGGTIPINVNPVAQTSKTDTSPQGNLAAFAVGVGDKGFNHSFVEHGHVLGLISVRAPNTYQQGMHRMWSRQTRFDFYWPTLANLGEQAVLNKEIYCDGSSADELVFGYQERWAEYRYRPSMVTGSFRSNHTASLDAWHLAMEFSSLPDIADIVPENPPVDRIVYSATPDQFQMDTFIQLRHSRPMPTYSIPGMIDHF